MKKLLITAALIASTMFPATQAASQSLELCKTYSEFVEGVANARDLGLKPSEIYEIAVSNGLDGQLVATVMELVFIDGKSLSPKILATLTYDNCRGY